MDQKNRTFVPHVLAVQTGTAVRFPNSDDIRHQVYSFSSAKTFQLPLYKGTPASPVWFDKAGVVSLGCNIHDHMIAYIYVVDSPWFAKANADGLARIENVPGGEYELFARHYAQAAPPAPIGLRVRADETATAAFSVGRRPMPPRPARYAISDAVAWFKANGYMR